MKKRERNVFIELMKNSKMSDRDIAKKLEISQPTVTRIRKKLEKNIIKSYTAVPVLSEIGINLISFNFGKCNDPRENMEVCLKKMIKKEPKITFTAFGEGMGKNCLIVAFHKGYRDYVNFLTSIREECRGVKHELDSFLVPTLKDHVLDFSKPITSLTLKEKKKTSNIKK